MGQRAIVAATRRGQPTQMIPERTLAAPEATRATRVGCGRQLGQPGGNHNLRDPPGWSVGRPTWLETKAAATDWNQTDRNRTARPTGPDQIGGGGGPERHPPSRGFPARIKDQRSKIKDQASRIKDQRSDPGSRIKDQGSRIKDQGPRTKDQGSRTKDQGPRTNAKGRRTKDQGPRTKDQ